MVQTAQVRAELVVHAPQGVEAGKPLWVGLQLQHEPHWHTYWKNPGDSGLPTQLEWTLPKGVQALDMVWPTPQKIAIGSLANYGYEGTVLLPVPLTVGKDFSPSLVTPDLRVELHASWLVCRKECIPQDGHFVVQIPVRGSTGLHAADFAAAQAASPLPLKGSSTAKVGPEGITFTVSGLPSAWRGQALNAFVETPEVIETAASPSTTDALATGTAPTLRGQAWQGSDWVAYLPLSAQRSASPEAIPLVLALGGITTAINPSLRVESRVSGSWPAVVPKANVSAALQAALDANTAPQSPRSNGLGSYAWALAAALLGGLILNLMPCVFPVLAIKLLGLTQQGGQSSNAQRTQGLAYGVGVVLSFMVLGAALLGLRAGGEQLGWGFQLQSPAVLAALAVLFTLLGLNLLDVLHIGNLLPNRLATLQWSHPVGDAFLSGVLAVAIASPCTAPFMGASLGLAITLPAAQALGIFAALGVGLASPYVLVSWVPAATRWLPRPGPWMQTLRRAMAFPMWATVVWLVWVLGHVSGVDGAASLLALLLGLSFAVWCMGLPGRGGKWIAIVSIAILALLTREIGQNVLHVDPPTATNSPTAESLGGQWQAWTPGRVQAELAGGKAVFVDFTAAWCITCQINKKTTLSHPDVVADFAAKRVTLLRADWTRRDPSITQALEAMGRSGVPVYVLYQSGKSPQVLSEILSVKEVRAALEPL